MSVVLNYNRRIMNLIIFGATGGTGKELIRQSLEMGHSVSVFVHKNIDSLGDLASKVMIFYGDVKNYNEVNSAIKGADVVLVALGTIPGKNDSMLSNGTKNIVKSMIENNVKRIIVETGAALVDDKKSLPAIWRLTSSMPLMKTMFDDKRLQEDAVINSGLDWFIVRPVNLTNGEQTNDYIISESIKKGMTFKISRSDVASFMLQHAISDEWIHRPAVISN